MLLWNFVLLVTIYHVTSLTVQEAGQFFNSRRYGGLVSVTENEESYIVSSNGLPDHETEPVNANRATPRTNVLIVPKTPVVAEVPGCLRQGPIAVTRTGVMIFNPLNAEQQNAVEGNTAEKFDSCDGHADPFGVYHYHKIPKSCMYKGEEDEFIGVALDGFPIYGPLASDLKRDIKNSDLDRCHGRFVNGKYRYHVTDEFPYYLGCFKGELPRAVPRMMDMFTVCNETSEFEKQFGGYLCACQGQLPSPVNRRPVFRPGVQVPGMPFPPGMPEQQRQQILLNQLREEQQRQQLLRRQQQMMANGQIPVINLGNNGMTQDPRTINPRPQVPLTIVRNGGQLVGNGQLPTGQLPGMVVSNGQLQPRQINGMIVGNGQPVQGTPTMVVLDRNGFPVEQRTGTRLGVGILGQIGQPTGQLNIGRSETDLNTETPVQNGQQSGTGLGTGTLTEMPEQVPTGPIPLVTPITNVSPGLINPQVGVAITQDGEQPLLLNDNTGVPLNGESIDTNEGTGFISNGGNFNGQRSGTGLGTGILGQVDQPTGQILDVERTRNTVDAVFQNGPTNKLSGTGLGTGVLAQIPEQLPTGPRRFQSPIPSGFRNPQIRTAVPQGGRQPIILNTNPGVLTNEGNIDMTIAMAQGNIGTPQTMRPPFMNVNIQQNPNQIAGFPSNMPIQGSRTGAMPVGPRGSFRRMPGRVGPFRGQPGQLGSFGRGLNGQVDRRTGQIVPLSPATVQTDSSRDMQGLDGPITEAGQLDTEMRRPFSSTENFNGDRQFRRQQNGSFRDVSVNRLEDGGMPSWLGSISALRGNVNKPDMEQFDFRRIRSPWNKRPRITAGNGPYDEFSLFNMYL